MKILMKFCELKLFCIILLFVACSGGNSDSSKDKDNGTLETNKELSLQAKAIINKNLFTQVNPGFEYSQMSDCAVLRLNEDLLNNTIPVSIPQIFILDRTKKSIFYSIDTKTVKEFSILSQTNDPTAIAVSKDGLVFISDRGSMSVKKFKFNGSTLQYISDIYSNIIVADITIDDNTCLYFADENQNRIVKTDSDGSPINSFTLNGTALNVITSYNNSDGIKLQLKGLRSIYVDLSGIIYTICDYGRTIVKFGSDGNTEAAMYISAKYPVVDITATDNAIYLVSNICNTLLLINKQTMDVMGKIVMPEHSEPWGKVNNISKMAVYVPSNLLVVFGKDGAEIFMEQF